MITDRPDAILVEGAETFRKRNMVYGDNFLHFGKMMIALFPDGVELRTANEWNRMAIMIHEVTKLSRYATNFEEGGHPDSAHDMMVYGAILEYLTKQEM